MCSHICTETIATLFTKKVTLFKKCLLVAAGPSEVSGAAAKPCATSVSTTTCASQPSGRVLTDAVLPMQRDTITAINGVTKELWDIKNVLYELNATMKEFINKLFE